MSASKLGRNDPCHCGSGKKYKKCCLIKAAYVDPTPPKEKELNGVIPSGVIPGTKKVILKSYVWKNHRWRIIWNGMHYRPLAETQAHRHRGLRRSEKPSPPGRSESARIVR